MLSNDNLSKQFGQIQLFDTPVVFLKYFSGKVYFEKSQPLTFL